MFENMALKKIFGPMKDVVMGREDSIMRSFMFCT